MRTSRGRDTREQDCRPHDYDSRSRFKETDFTVTIHDRDSRLMALTITIHGFDSEELAFTITIHGFDSMVMSSRLRFNCYGLKCREHLHVKMGSRVTIHDYGLGRKALHDYDSTVTIPHGFDSRLRFAFTIHDYGLKLTI